MAIEAVARRFSATFDESTDSPGACLMLSGKRIGVDVVTLQVGGIGRRNAVTPRLRFDRVVIGLMERLRSALREAVPDGVTVLLAITAPIRLPSKTAAALEGRIQTLLGRGMRGRDAKDTVHGNRIRIRVLRGESGQAPRLIGFVHNSDVDPVLFLDATRELVAAVGGREAHAAEGNQWLVIVSAGDISGLAAYRYICSQLRAARDYQKVVMVFGGGRVEEVQSTQAKSMRRQKHAPPIRA